MKYREIRYYNLINEVDEAKVKEIAESIRNNGFIGCPILVTGEELITGSHRLAALKMLDEEGDLDEDIEVAEDVTELVEEAFVRFEEENFYTPDLDCSDIGWIFEGTWVEEYKNEIEEW